VSKIEEELIRKSFRQAMEMDKPITRRALCYRLQKMRGWDLLTQHEKTNFVDEILKLPQPRKYLFGNTRPITVSNIASYLLKAFPWGASKKGSKYWYSLYNRVQAELHAHNLENSNKETDGYPEHDNTYLEECKRLLQERGDGQLKHTKYKLHTGEQEVKTREE